MGDFLGEAIGSCDSIDMLKHGLEHIKDKIRQLESENEIDEDETDVCPICQKCEYYQVEQDEEPCKSCKLRCNFSEKII